jgi:hypothetical protein
MGSIPPMDIAILVLVCISILLLLIVLNENYHGRKLLMATIEEAAARVRSEFTALGDRVNTDVAELKRIIQEEGVSNDRVNAVIASLETTASDMAGIDPLPDFPAAPTPPDGGGGGTTPPDGGTTPPDGGTPPVDGGTPTNGGATV